MIPIASENNRKARFYRLTPAVELHIDDNIRAGMSLDAARRDAWARPRWDAC
ncbi:MAG TPA: hypothetical protein VKE51_32800 [Vicinamibacterales bacterium]|nr:hypothetical protein [Vicinamibacterales bacterium]